MTESRNPTTDSNKVIVAEVGPRDGLQATSAIMTTRAKKEWIQQAWEAGIPEVQVGSFVPARLLPQMADTAEVLAFALTLPGMRSTVLVPNLKGAEAAVRHGAKHVVVPVSVSRAHSQANVRATPEAMVETVAAICRLRDSLPPQERVEVRAGLSTVYGCTLQGEVSERDVVELAVACVSAGADCVGLADTTGHANPAQVRRVNLAVRREIGNRLSGGHFHDTRGMGLANVVAALDCGIRRFDACLGGLGGCPHAPGATGNIVSEDLIFMLESMGFDTGIDLERVIATRALLARELASEPMHGHVWRTKIPEAMKRTGDHVGSVGVAG